MNKMNKRGFTLIEVIVVTLIIAALALLVVPSFKNSALTNQMEKAKVGLVELTTAVKLYREVNTGALSGVFDDNMFSKLTTEDEQGYIYLRNQNRWAHRPGSATDYSLIDANGVLNCKYTINDATSNVLSSVLCEFDKIDQAGTECYNFFINRDNPAVIKKQDGDCSGL